MRQTSVSSLTKTKKKEMLASLDELSERMPSLLDIDRPCAQRQILDARRVVEVCSTNRLHYPKDCILYFHCLICMFHFMYTRFQSLNCLRCPI